ncbi:TPA: hypothetical protein HA371_06985 [Candidatus Woesearchaeota archaeon]|nr:hypothetical protein [Candidatus Woesearchaeota archaeon]
MVAVTFSKGKAEFVKRKMPDGTVQDVCLCAHNVDFSVNWCIAQVPVHLLDEVIHHKGGYAPGKLTDYIKQGVSDNRCTYCYDKRVNHGKVTPREVNQRTREEFETKKPEIIRIGKSTESGHPYYYPVLIDFLNLCREFKTRVIFTTKAFPFGLQGALETTDFAEKRNDSIARLAKSVNMASGEELAERLIGINATLLYSVSNDSFEYGMVSQGFTNQWRINQAVKYHSQKVNTSLTIVCDVTQSIDENDKRGFALKRGLEERDKTGINIRILPIRINSDELALKVTGKNMRILRDHGHHGTKPLFETDSPSNGLAPYKRRGNNELFAGYFHSDFQNLFDSGIGVCGAVGDYEHCDKCLLCPEKVRFPLKDIPKIIYDQKPGKRPSAEGRALRKHPKLFTLRKKKGGEELKRHDVFDENEITTKDEELF